MKNTGELVVSVTIDTTEIEHQATELNALLKSALKGASDDLACSLISNLQVVLDDIIMSYSPSASGARFEIVHRARLGAKYERFTAAIRAGEFNLESI